MTPNKKKKCILFLSLMLLLLWAETYSLKSKNELFNITKFHKFKLTKEQEAILSPQEIQLLVEVRLNKRNVNNFVQEKLYGEKTIEEEKNILKTIVLKLLNIYAKLNLLATVKNAPFTQLENDSAALVTEEVIGFLFYELYKRESQQKLNILKEELEKSLNNLFEFRPFNFLIHEYEKMLKKTIKTNIRTFVRYAQKRFLAVFNNLYTTEKKNEEIIKNLLKPKPTMVSTQQLENNESFFQSKDPISNENQTNLKAGVSENEALHLQPKEQQITDKNQPTFSTKTFNAIILEKFKKHWKFLITYYTLGFSFLGYKIYQQQKK